MFDSFKSTKMGTRNLLFISFLVVCICIKGQDANTINFETGIHSWYSSRDTDDPDWNNRVKIKVEVNSKYLTIKIDGVFKEFSIKSASINKGLHGNQNIKTYQGIAIDNSGIEVEYWWFEESRIKKMKNGKKNKYIIKTGVLELKSKTGNMINRYYLFEKREDDYD